MRYINQFNYRHVPYPTRTKVENATEEQRNTTVSQSGCGLCCVCMMVDLLTDTTLEIEECVKISQDCIANHSVGTDMSILAPVIAEKYNLDYRNTDDMKEAIAHLQRGGQIVAHVGVPEGQEIGLFTKGGHYISLIGTDGESFCILDPSYKPGKFDVPERAGKVNDAHAPFLYCNVKTLDAEGRIGQPTYHLFSRKCD